MAIRITRIFSGNDPVGSANYLIGSNVLYGDDEISSELPIGILQEVRHWNLYPYIVGGVAWRKISTFEEIADEKLVEPQENSPKVYNHRNKFEASHLVGKKVLCGNDPFNVDGWTEDILKEILDSGTDAYAFGARNSYCDYICEIQNEQPVKIESFIYNRSDEKVKCPLCDEMVDGEIAESHASSHRVHQSIIEQMDKMKIDSIFGEGTHEKMKTESLETNQNKTDVSGFACTSSSIGNYMYKDTFNGKLHVMLEISRSCKTKEDLIRWIVCDGEPADESCIGHAVLVSDYYDTPKMWEWDTIEITLKKTRNDNGYVSYEDNEGLKFKFAKKIPGYDYSPKPEVEKKLKPVDENCLYKPVLTIGSYKEDRGQILVGIYDDAMCIFKKDYLKLEIMADKNNVYRIDGYDYGDGGNYE